MASSRSRRSAAYRSGVVHPTSARQKHETNRNRKLMCFTTAEHRCSGTARSGRPKWKRDIIAPLPGAAKLGVFVGHVYMASDVLLAVPFDQSSRGVIECSVRRTIRVCK